MTDYIPLQKYDNILWDYGIVNYNICCGIYDSQKRFITYYRNIYSYKSEEPSYFHYRREIIQESDCHYMRFSLSKEKMTYVLKNGVCVFNNNSIEQRVKRIEDSTIIIEDNAVVLNVAAYNMGDFSGKNMLVPTDEAALTYRKLLGKLNSNIIATQEDVQRYGDPIVFTPVSD